MRNNKIIINAIIPFVAIILSYCSKVETFEDVESNERSILNVKVDRQVGGAAIIDSTSTINLTVFGDMETLKTLAPKFDVSYGAKIHPANGSKVDFTANTDNSMEYTVTSQSGKQRKWKVIVGIYENPYQGTWHIEGFNLKWDDNHGWGNAGEGSVFTLFPTAAPGADDVITFGVIEGFNASGAFYGNYERTLGVDNATSQYIFIDPPKGNIVPAGPRDWSYKFDILPAGKGKYFINTDNTISVEIDGITTRTNLSASFTEGKINYELPVSIGYLDNLNFDEQFDWSDYYGNPDNKALVPTRIWYVLSK